jgi:RNA polymerase sigma factor (sigma-70 family)
MAHPEAPVTRLLTEWRAGNDAALAQLSSLLYDELRRIAQHHLRRERPNHTIQKTALVNEAFVRLLGQQSVDWQNRSQFFAIASNTMRRVLVDHARARQAGKRGGGAVISSLDLMGEVADRDDRPNPAPTPAALLHTDDQMDETVVAIDAALARLGSLDPRQVQVVEMRYFAGMTVEETADALGISPATVKREWTMARAWLREQLAGILR